MVLNRVQDHSLTRKEGLAVKLCTFLQYHNLFNRLVRTLIFCRIIKQDLFFYYVKFYVNIFIHSRVTNIFPTKLTETQAKISNCLCLLEFFDVCHDIFINSYQNYKHVLYSDIKIYHFIFIMLHYFFKCFLTIYCSVYLIKNPSNTLWCLRFSIKNMYICMYV